MSNPNSSRDDAVRGGALSGLRLLGPFDLAAGILAIAMTLWPLTLGMGFAPRQEDVAKGNISSEAARSGAPLHQNLNTSDKPKAP